MSRALIAELANLREWYESHLGHDSFDGVVAAFDPSTGDPLVGVPKCTAAAVRQAVASAAAAQPEWARLPAGERGRLLYACADRFEVIGNELAELLALESGKAIETECRGETGLLVESFRYFAGLAHELKGHTTELGPGILGFTTRKPYGVVAGIVPWNVPLLLMSYKVAAPLLAGNTVVVKIPEQTSFTLIRVLKEMQAVLPEGIVTFLTGSGASTGNELVNDPAVDKVSFTGSVETGRHVYTESARRLRPVTLELGGKSPMVLLDDCDLEIAVDGIVQSMRFTRGGQSCTAASRIFVPAARAGELRAALAAALDGIIIGPALDPATQCGPLVSAAQRDKVAGFVARARSDGLAIDEYGIVADGVDWDAGYYARPCVVFDPPDDHPIAVEEIFGPVVCLFTYDSVGEALGRANRTEFGLSASVWGRDINTCMRLADDLEAGIIQINQNAVMVPGIAYGGIRNSGVGSEGSLEAMLGSYTYAKTNIVNYGEKLT